jgi:hypothetical protein
MSRSDTSCADLNALDGTVSHGFNFLQVRIPDSTGFVVSVTYIISKAGAFPADFANFRHDHFLLCIMKLFCIANLIGVCKGYLMCFVLSSFGMLIANEGGGGSGELLARKLI